MKFTKLVIENFLAITKAEVDLSDRGLVLIQGSNLDDSSATSNGAGKSSIADALSWVLYGITARGITGDDIVNDTEGKNTMVAVRIEDDGQSYVIRRHRKHKTGKNSLTVINVNTTADLSKGTDKLTQDLVNKIIGASHEVFRAAVYAGQEQMPDLPAATDKALKMLIEEASGVTILEEAYQEARERAAAVNAAAATVAAELKSKQDRESWIVSDLKQEELSLSAWSSTNEAEQAVALDAATDQMNLCKQADVELAKTDEPALQAAIDKCDADIAAVSSQIAEQGRLNKLLSDAEVDMSLAQRKYGDNIKLIDAIKKQSAELSHKVGCPCNECDRPLGEEDIAPAQAVLLKRIEAEKANLTSARALAAETAELAEKRQEELDAFSATMTDLTATNAQRSALTRQMSIHVAKKNERTGLATRAKNLGAKYKALKDAVNPYLEKIERAKVELSNTRATIITLQTTVIGRQKEADQAAAVIKVFSPAGVRARILDDVTPFLNQQTAEYLAILSDGNIEAIWTTLVKTAKGELREKFSIEVTNSKGAKSFMGLSGGEKRKVRIATSLALQDLVATRATKPIELFIADEIDDALDTPGLERLMNILDEKAKERGSVFIISHRDLKDWISQILTVEKENGVTTISETTA